MKCPCHVTGERIDQHARWRGRGRLRGDGLHPRGVWCGGMTCTRGDYLNNDLFVSGKRIERTGQHARWRGIECLRGVCLRPHGVWCGGTAGTSLFKSVKCSCHVAGKMGQKATWRGIRCLRGGCVRQRGATGAIHVAMAVWGAATWPSLAVTWCADCHIIYHVLILLRFFSYLILSWFFGGPFYGLAKKIKDKSFSTYLFICF